MKNISNYPIALATSLLFSISATGSAFAGANSMSPEKAQSLYEKAYIYALPINMSYKTLYAYAVDEGGANFKAPFNQIKNTARVYGPKDTAVVSANSDTPYSLLWMDLRAEPVVLCVPKVDKKRYYSAMIQDLSTNLLPYMGTRTTGSDGSCSMVTGPDFKGDAPKGIDQTIQSETAFVIAVYRTQLFNADDLDNVKTVQKGYLVKTLSDFTNKSTPAAAAKIDFPKWDEKAATGDDFISFLNFNLQFIRPTNDEMGLLKELQAIGVGPGMKFDATKLTDDQKKALSAGIASAKKKIATKVSELPGPRGDTAKGYGDDWLQRAAVTQLGWGANSEKEALYPNLAKDGEGNALDGSKGKYTLTFAKDALPPVNAFWSLTMYDGKTQLMIENPLNRYLLNSTMIEQMKKNDDGSLTLYFQKDAPDDALKANWLPAPDGPFYMLMRLYWPKKEILDGTWKQPAVKKAK
jgi:hypothetical protein